MISALISIFLNSLAQLALKKASSNFVNILDLLKTPFLYISGFLYFTSIFLWIYTLRNMDISLAFPLQSLGYVFVFASGVYFFGESWNSLSLIGILAIVIGAILLGISKI